MSIGPRWRNSPLLTVLLCFALLQTTAASSAADRHSLMLIAHRGVRKLAPENTLPAIEKAVEMKLEFVEIDVRATSDGRLVLMHDPDVDRSTDGTGFVHDLTFDQIRSFDAGVREGPDFEGTQVPSLEEALSAARGRTQLYVHWKDAAPEALASEIARLHAWDSVVVLGSAKNAAALMRLDPCIRVTVDIYTEPVLREVLRWAVKPMAVSPDIDSLNAGIVRDCHAAGVMVFADMHGPDESCDDVRRALELGVDAVQTDNPDIIAECLSALSRRAPADERRSVDR